MEDPRESLDSSDEPLLMEVVVAMLMVDSLLHSSLNLDLDNLMERDESCLDEDLDRPELDGDE